MGWIKLVKSIVKILKYIFIICSIFSIIYFLNNFNQFKIYEISGSGKNLSFIGVASFNKKKNIFFISDFTCPGYEYGENVHKLVKKVTISLVEKDSNKYNSDRLIGSVGTYSDESFALTDYLRRTNLYLREWYWLDEMFTKKTIKHMNKSLFIKLELIDDENNELIEYIKVNGYAISNDKFFYKK